MNPTINIPNKAFDMEYSTQWRKESEFLSSRGIEPTYRKKGEYGVPVYKYKKTPELFIALADFYLHKESYKKGTVTQLTFLNKDNTIKEEYIQPESNTDNLAAKVNDVPVADSVITQNVVSDDTE